MSVSLSSISNDVSTTFSQTCPKAPTPLTSNNSTTVATTAYLTSMKALTVLLNVTTALIGTFTFTATQAFSTLQAGAGILSFTAPNLTIGRITTTPPITVLGNAIIVGTFTRWTNSNQTNATRFLCGNFGPSVSGVNYNYPTACVFPTTPVAFSTPINSGVTMSVVAGTVFNTIYYTGGTGNQGDNTVIIG